MSAAHPPSGNSRLSPSIVHTCHVSSAQQDVPTTYITNHSHDIMLHEPEEPSIQRDHDGLSTNQKEVSILDEPIRRQECQDATSHQETLILNEPIGNSSVVVNTVPEILRVGTKLASNHKVSNDVLLKLFNENRLKFEVVSIDGCSSDTNRTSLDTLIDQHQQPVGVARPPTHTTHMVHPPQSLYSTSSINGEYYYTAAGSTTTTNLTNTTKNTTIIDNIKSSDIFLEQPASTPALLPTEAGILNVEQSADASIINSSISSPPNNATSVINKRPPSFRTSCDPLGRPPCPVCGAPVFPSLSSHLATHPKRKLIQALVKLTGKSVNSTCRSVNPTYTKQQTRKHLNVSSSSKKRNDINLDKTIIYLSPSHSHAGSSEIAPEGAPTGPRHHQNCSHEPDEVVEVPQPEHESRHWGNSISGFDEGDNPVLYEEGDPKIGNPVIYESGNPKIGTPVIYESGNPKIGTPVIYENGNPKIDIPVIYEGGNPILCEGSASLDECGGVVIDDVTPSEIVDHNTDDAAAAGGGHPGRKKRKKGVPSRAPHACPVCSKVFSNRGNVSKHLTLHSSHKPWNCSVCNVGFNSNRAWEHHNLQNHTSDRPFACSVCSKTFAVHDNLKV